jgi:transposase
MRETYREDGKVKHRTIANLSQRSPEEIEAIRLALRYKGELKEPGSASDWRLEQGASMGAVWLLYKLATQLGIRQALGSSYEAKLALWQVLARAIDQGSRLSAVRLAQTHAACDILDLEVFDEDDLYRNLDWLADHQHTIENRLFRKRYSEPPKLFLYDVTSTYLEGVKNVLAAFGYNRDKKRGKLQLVIGLLCDESGIPLSIEVFEGNTKDTNTLASQIKKVAERFGGNDVTFVGDRGMIKSKQIEDIFDKQFHYITAITKPQIEKLLKEETFQMGLFDEDLAEVIVSDKLRYILRRNPLRAKEVCESRGSKLKTVKKRIGEKLKYLQEHPRAQAQTAKKEIARLIEKLKLADWLTIKYRKRTLILETDDDKLADISKLDGCYVLKTDLSKEKASKEIIHDRYKDLKHVEWAFRTEKTVLLEIRPVNVRKEKRTRGHVFVVMLAYLIIQELTRRWRSIDQTVEEAIKELTQLCAHTIIIDGVPTLNKIPIPRKSSQKLLDAAGVKLPEFLPHKGVEVATRAKLPKRRKSH